MGRPKVAYRSHFVLLNTALQVNATSFTRVKDGAGLYAAGGKILYGWESSCRGRILPVLFDYGMNPTCHIGSS